eukprot:GHVT01011458.1.p1 GENE.GHVT01011458.1~~GHVT01011458.1.p1  ORF type:complete len:214 (+),score=32.44 GHVT01011458.1:720-1361(+)
MEAVIKPKACSKPVVKEIEEPCASDVDEEVCHDQPTLVTRTAYRYDTREESYPCPRIELEEKCWEVKTPKQMTCTATLMKTVQVPSFRHEFAEICEDRTEFFFQPCIKDRVDEEDYPCPEQGFETKCVTITTYEMGTCYTAVQSVAQNPCEGKEPVVECHTNDVPRDATCFQMETKQTPYTCYETAYQEECVDLLLTGPRVETPAKKKPQHKH